MRKTDKAAEIAEKKPKTKRLDAVAKLAKFEYPYNYDFSVRRRALITKRIRRIVRSAIKAERARCVRVIEQHKKDNHSADFMSGRYVCDELIKLLAPKLKKKARGKR